MTFSSPGRVITHIRRVIAVGCALGLVAAALVMGFESQLARAAFPGENGMIVYDCADGICVVEPDGSTQRYLASGDNYTPAFSPDGRQVAFVRPSSTGYELYLVNIDGSGYRKLTEFSDLHGNTDPYFSADGSRIVFGAFTGDSEEDEVYDLYSVDTGTGTDLTRLTTGAFAANPAWSSTGRLAWQDAADRDDFVDGSHEIYVDGQNITNDATCFSEETFEDPCAFHDSDPEWAPDGSYLVFTRYDEPYDGRGTIYRIDPTGSTMTPLVEGEHPAISPDGTKLSFSRDGKLFVADSNGANPTKIRSLGSAPSWGDRVPPIVHEREITFKINDHSRWQFYVTATGTLSVDDGYSECVSQIPLEIQQKVGTRWKRLAFTGTVSSTTGSSTFKKRFRHVAGKYRAIVQEHVAIIDVCTADKSPVFSDPHGY